MFTRNRSFIVGTLVLALAFTFGTGCSKKNDAISKAEKTEKDRPGIAETRAIAEEGFI